MRKRTYTKKELGYDEYYESVKRRVLEEERASKASLPKYLEGLGFKIFGIFLAIWIVGAIYYKNVDARYTTETTLGVVLATIWYISWVVVAIGVAVFVTPEEDTSFEDEIKRRKRIREIIDKEREQK